MTYWRYWKLSGPPFTNDVRRGFFRSASADEALARIDFLVENRRQLGVVLGSSGVGKTSLLKHFGCSVPRYPGIPNVQLINLSMLGLTSGELYGELVRTLCGGRVAGNAHWAWRALCDYFSAAQREGTHTIALIDDAESSSASAEEDLNRLIATAAPLTVLIAVESQLGSAVSRNLWERSDLQIELPAWDLEQTRDFLKWNFQRLGRSGSPFTVSATARIQELSGGIVRKIVQLADLSLVAGAVAHRDSVDVECVDQVSAELPRSAAFAA